MKTAEEMFNDLNYEKKEDSDSLLLYQYKNPYDMHFGIFFWKSSKSYQHRLKEQDGRESAWHTTVDEHKAIYQQLKEMGWLDENC